MVYRPVVPGTLEPVPFSSPWRTITIDRVDDVSDQVPPQFRAVPRIGQGELHERLEVGLEVADVVTAFALQPHAIDFFPLLDEQLDRIRIDLTRILHVRATAQIRELAMPVK